MKTEDAAYAERLRRAQQAPWKRILDVQRPYRAHPRTLTVAANAAELALALERQYSFPFPRPVGCNFKYNEFVSIARKPLERRGDTR